MDVQPVSKALYLNVMHNFFLPSWGTLPHIVQSSMLNLRALGLHGSGGDDADDDDGDDDNDVCLLCSQLHRQVEGVVSKRRRVSAGVLGRAFKALFGHSTRRARGNSNQRPPHFRRTSPQQNLQVSS